MSVLRIIIMLHSLNTNVSKVDVHAKTNIKRQIMQNGTPWTTVVIVVIQYHEKSVGTPLVSKPLIGLYFFFALQKNGGIVLITGCHIG